MSDDFKARVYKHANGYWWSVDLFHNTYSFGTWSAAVVFADEWARQHRQWLARQCRS